jgi:transposase, IS30 family
VVGHGWLTTREVVLGRKRILSDSEVALARRLYGQGWTLKEIGARFGLARQTVWGSVRAVGPERPVLGRRDGWQPGRGRLCLEEREEISRGLLGGETLTAIASGLGRSTSTVSREVAANGGREGYRGWAGHSRAWQCARRPKAAKLSYRPLIDEVEAGLEAWWSPDEISRRLRREFPDDPMMWVSHETIYQSLYVQGRGELRRELARCLRSGRVRRRSHGRSDKQGHIAGMVNISERPAEIEDRAVPGHWEGDLILGQNNKSAVGTLVERATRYVLLLHLPDGHRAEQVDLAMRKAIAKLPGELFRTITWDQGVEMSRHAAFTIDTGIQVYFCDPHSPWQRGSNENTNGLLRQYMPKGTDLSLHSQADLDTFARSLNNRPRKTLEYLKPSERLSELLAHTG